MVRGISSLFRRTVLLSAALFLSLVFGVKAEVLFPEGRLFSVGKEGKVYAYIFPTYDLADPRLKDLHRHIRYYWADSRYVLTDFGLTNKYMDDDEFIQDHFLDDGNTLEDVVGADTWRMLIDSVGGIFNEEGLNELAPWSVRALIWSGSIDIKNRLHGMETLQDSITNASSRYGGGKKIFALTDVKSMQRFYRRIPLYIQKEFVYDGILSFNFHNKYYEEIIDLYIKGDWFYLDKFSRERYGRPPESVESYIVYNSYGIRLRDAMYEILVDQIEAASTAEAGPYHIFVATWFRNVVYTGGLLDKFVKDGYEVAPVVF